LPPEPFDGSLQLKDLLSQVLILSMPSPWLGTMAWTTGAFSTNAFNL
jgi:hypothetical protein